MLAYNRKGAFSEKGLSVIKRIRNFKTLFVLVR